LIKYDYSIKGGAGGRNGSASISGMEISFNSDRMELAALNDKGDQISGSFLTLPLSNVPELVEAAASVAVQADPVLKQKILDSLRAAMIVVELSADLNEASNPSFYRAF
jgi:hypothetical protein